MAVIFPRVTKLRLHGFNKIFTENDFEIDFSKNLSIILGGNGLGKTTLLQCIIYALTGGVDDSEIEETKNYRWNHTYFRGKINNDAFVYIEFFLGNNWIQLKRGFNSSRILECVSYTKEHSLEEIVLEEKIKEYGNYDSFSDFSFIINRLLYLPENRRSLLWDYDAQIRTLMIISKEFVAEQDYRHLRRLIKLKDSNKRKVNWYIGKIEKRKTLQSGNQVNSDLEENSNEFRHNYIQLKKDLLAQFQELNYQNKKLYESIKSDQENRNCLAQFIAEIGDQIRVLEADFIQKHLLEYDEKNVLIFQKTLKTGYCPACDQKSEKLKTIIEERIKSGKCLICGELISKHNLVEDNSDLESLNSQLYEKIVARNALDLAITQNKSKLAKIEENISNTRDELSKLEFDYSGELLDDEDEKDTNSEDERLIAEEYTLRQQEEELGDEINKLTKDANEMYDAFIKNFQARYEQLHEIYSDLASRFLGLPVELRYTKSTAKFVDMDYLIPHFSDIDRGSPETCSEAQRFFLDIAFRMSVISLNKAISGIDSTFICETPENALDISYIDNVVKMFISFMEKGGNLILTNNLQRLGIAQVLIREANTQKIPSIIFDLLEYGKLSEIQSSSDQLIEIRNDILKEVKNG